MVIHVEIDSATVGKHTVQRVPLDTDVVHKFRLHIEVGDKILGPMTDVDSVMTICATRLIAYAPARTGCERDIAYRAEVRGIQIDPKVGIPDLNIADPAL